MFCCTFHVVSGSAINERTYVWHSGLLVKDRDQVTKFKQFFFSFWFCSIWLDMKPTISVDFCLQCLIWIKDILFLVILARLLQLEDMTIFVDCLLGFLKLKRSRERQRTYISWLKNKIALLCPFHSFYFQNLFLLLFTEIGDDVKDLTFLHPFQKCVVWRLLEQLQWWTHHWNP